jgi:hypothetical protein
MPSQPLSVKLLLALLEQSTDRAREGLGAMFALVPLEPWMFDDGDVTGDPTKVPLDGKYDVVSTAAGLHVPAWRAPVYPLSGEIERVGRSWKSDLIIDQPTVSAHHAEISRVDGIFRINDQGSRNGTIVNGQLLRLNSMSRLDDGDVVVFGEAQTVFSGLEHLADLFRRMRLAQKETRRG